MQQTNLGRLWGPCRTGPRRDPQGRSLSVRRWWGIVVLLEGRAAVDVPSQGLKLTSLIESADGHQRCWWPGTDHQYIEYHDTEWGRPVIDRVALFEKLCLEGFQSGLSWLTILRKRENFRGAFEGFDPARIAAFNADDVERLMQDASIVRHRGKIEAVINNARCLVNMESDGVSLPDLVWSYAVDAPHGRWPSDDGDAMASTSAESIALSRHLKKSGWKFVGPTTIYSMMQSMGVVNDHMEGCFVRDECERERVVTVGSMRPGAK